SDSTALIEAMPLLAERDRLFVLGGDRSVAIVTRGDLQKAPVRMYLNGVVVLLEMQTLRLVRILYSGDDWIAVLGRNRLAAARALFEERVRRNEQIDLVDC